MLPVSPQDTPDPFGYKKVRYFGIAIWLVISSALTAGLILYQVPPIDILVEAAAGIQDTIVANLAVFVVVWLALHLPLAAIYLVFRYIRRWFTFN